MFHAKEDSKANGSDNFTARARDTGTAAAITAAHSAAAAAQTAATAAQIAAHSMSGATQTAAAGVNKGVRQGVYNARGWAAPRLESAADYTTATMAPRVAAALRATATHVNPEDVSRKKTRSALAWSLLGAAVLAALGAAGALARHRYRAATSAAETGATGTGTGAPADTAGPADTAQADSAGTATSTDTGVNGRVSTSGW